jgi:Fe-S cluster assembly protein SufB
MKQLCIVLRGLYGSKSWRKSIARGSSRINCAWWWNKIFNRKNWYPGNKEGRWVYNFVTKRGFARKRKNILDTVETGSAITWKYPSVVLKVTTQLVILFDSKQIPASWYWNQMIHLGKKINRLFQGNFCWRSQNSYRGLVRISPNADNARNFSQCDSLLMGNNCGAHTFPYIESKTNCK